MTAVEIRPTEADDIPATQTIVNATGLFPSDLVPDLIAPALAGETKEFWRTAHVDGTVVGFAYTVPEMLAEGTWNMTAIAVDPDHQRKGIGSALIAGVEADLRETGQRVLFVDTSSTESFDQTRAFYLHNGYDEEARIRDFWAAGDDKVIFRKSLD